MISFETSTSSKILKSPLATVPPPKSPSGAEERATYLYHAAHVLRRGCPAESRLMVKDMILADDEVRKALHPSIVESICTCGEVRVRGLK